MPLGTPVTVILVAELPVENSAMFDRLGSDPATIAYDGGVHPNGASQLNVTVVPETSAVSALGRSYARLQGRADWIAGDSAETTVAANQTSVSNAVITMMPAVIPKGWNRIVPPIPPDDSF